MHDMSIAELSAALKAGAFSSLELIKSYLDRVDRLSSRLNAFITVTHEQALDGARKADGRLKSSEAGPLTGIPIAHKDIFCTNAIKTSCGSKMLENFIAPYDATVIERFSNAGAVMLGKTNMDEFAMGSSNETSYFGPVHNPWDYGRVPGGSSGGSAAVVAARLAPGATGTDTGGSIRQPASLCGVTGLKPTYGLVSRYGMVAFASSLDQAGPLGRSAEDCALMLGVMAGFDPRDSTSIPRKAPDYHAALGQPLDGLRIGLVKEYFSESLDQGVVKAIEAAIEVYRSLGCEVSDISLPNLHLSVPVYYVVAPAECSSNLARFDGVRYGYRCENPHDLTDLYTRSRGEGFGPEVKRRIMIGSYVLSAGYYDAYYLKAQQIRRLISEDFKQAFRKVDLIMGPTAPTTAFKIGDKIDDPITMYLSDINTIAVNLAGLPAISIPAGMQEGLPVGLQIIGDYFSEQCLLNVAYQFQQQTNWHHEKPRGFE